MLGHNELEYGRVLECPPRLHCTMVLHSRGRTYTTSTYHIWHVRTYKWTILLCHNAPGYQWYSTCTHTHHCTRVRTRVRPPYTTGVVESTSVSDVGVNSNARNEQRRIEGTSRVEWSRSHSATIYRSWYWESIRRRLSRGTFSGVSTWG